MEHAKICQSCGAAMDGEVTPGTNADGSMSDTYCCYCYQNGAFEDPNATLEETVEVCIPYAIEAGEARTPEDARVLLREHLSQLKRWKAEPKE